MGLFFLEKITSLCVHASGPDLFLDEVPQISHSDHIVFPAEAVGTALDYVKLHISGSFVGRFCPESIVRVNDSIGSAMDDQYRAGYPLDMLIGIHIQHIGRITLAKLHGTAVDDLRQIVGIKPGKHHLAGAGIVRDAQCRIKQHQLVCQPWMLCRSNSRHEAALAASHKQQFVPGVGVNSGHRQ